MATATEAPPADRMPGGQPLDISSDLFFAMIGAGLIGPERRVSLWGGRIYEEMAKTVPHATTSVRIQEALRRRLPPGWLLWPENPIRLDARHAPLPNVTVVRGPVERYEQDQRHPTPEDAGLVVEIAVTSLPRDLGERAEKFARALIPVYWVADIGGRQILVHDGPRIVEGVGEYGRIVAYGPGQGLPLILDDREVGPVPFEELMR